MNELSFGRYQAQCAAEKELLTQFMDEVWSGGNIDACDRFIADEYTIRNDPGDPWHGQTLSLDGFKERVRLSRAPFPDQTFDIQAMVAEPDKVAITWAWQGTFLGDVAGFKADGRVIRMTGMTLYDYTDGKLSGHWQLCDRLGVFQQLQASA